MTTLRVIATWLFLFLPPLAGTIVAQTTPENEGSESAPPIPILITQKVDETRLITLAGNTRPEVNAKNDRGQVRDSFSLEHMMLLLQRSPGQEQALEELIDRLHDSESPDFHRWLTARQLGQTYGLAAHDIGTVTDWLTSHGFSVDAVYPNRLVIDFSGTAGQVRRAFHTEIHQLEVGGKNHIANMTDPQIPAALGPAVVGVVSLSDFMPQPMYQPRSNLTTGNCSAPTTFTCYYLVPADLATIYNLNPLFNAGISGQGQTIALVENTDVFSHTDWSVFRNVLGLSGFSGGSFTETHPAPPKGTNNCADPHTNPDDGEAILDAEWSSAAAPNAAILMISCADTATTFGGFIALQNLLSAGSPPAILSISYGESETDTGATTNAFINSLYQQAATAGVSVFVSSGDQSAAVSDRGANFATHGINVNGWGSTTYNVSVGGTDFGDTFAGANGVYWSGTNNGVTWGSALSYIPEIPWNNSCASQLITTFFGFLVPYGTSGFCNSGNGGLDVVGGSGGPSACATGAPKTSGVVSGTCKGYAKPTWQSVFGNPADGVRDLPDVSLFAASGVWGHSYVYCYTDAANGGTPCTGTPDTWSLAGGTSFASPIMAAIQSLINQATHQRWGNPNPTYYSLASAEYGKSGNSNCNSSLGNGVAGSCIFYDVTQGDMDVPCEGTVNCYRPSGTVGVLSTSNTTYQPAYGTHVGWDFATGIGTLNAYNLEQAFLSRSHIYKRETALAEQVDHFGEGRADFSVWRPSNGTFYSLDGSGEEMTKQWGVSTDVPLIGDYDGDGKTDFGVWRPSNGTWYIIQSNGKEVIRAWGAKGDIPVPGDYDGDGKTDFAVFRPSNGTWYILQSSNLQEVIRPWGAKGDIPVPGDYDGDGKTDFAIFRPSTGTWYILQSSNLKEVIRPWGAEGDIPAPGDYDGDGKTDVAIWRPTTGTWYILQSSNLSEVVKAWGTKGDIPVSRDYDGDGKNDLAVWRPSNGTWYVIPSTTGKSFGKTWGVSTDIPMNKPVGQ